MDGRRDCNFVKWHDGEVNQPDKKIIRALLRRIDAKDTKERFLVAWLVVSRCITFFILVLIVMKFG